jgi:hypothetical protein
MLLAKIAAIGSIPVLLGIAALHVPSVDERYYVNRGLDYREVDRSVFEARRPFCANVSERDFPDAHLILHHCAR